MMNIKRKHIPQLKLQTKELWFVLMMSIYKKYFFPITIDTFSNILLKFQKNITSIEYQVICFIKLYKDDNFCSYPVKTSCSIQIVTEELWEYSYAFTKSGTFQKAIISVIAINIFCYWWVLNLQNLMAFLLAMLSVVVIYT